ncbi:MAG TPA: branched chain amino acid aminotransferase, partial [Paenibacillaceae bacterium]|nr:branched chain amino acid aminotransferase [Paenibacillaceae bacterium]
MGNGANLDWENLGFLYRETNANYVSYWKDGAWDEGKLVEEKMLTISMASPALHYGQQCFEGLKAYRRKDGTIGLFRPDQNAKRMQDTCRRLLMPEVSEEKFIEAVKMVVKANEEFVPPYGSGATLYIRPFIIGVGDNIGVKPATEYIFCVFVTPVGPYFKGGMTPIKMVVTDYDRAAPHGTGAVKVGGNYAASLLPHEIAAKEGYSDCVYLDPKTHTKIEEVGAANFIGITKENVLVTPKSPSILPSITKYSLLYIAENIFGMKVEERDVYINNLDEFVEAGACGTAAVISPLGSLTVGDEKHVFYSETEVGPVVKKLYNHLIGIQYG